MQKKATAKGATQNMPARPGAPLTKAPELWRGERATGETRVDFFRRIYAPWLAQGLDEQQLKRLDPKLWVAIRADRRHGGRQWPAELALPNRRNKVEKSLELIGQGRWQELTDEEIVAALRKRIRDRKKRLKPG